jgi:hypothetical protein
MNEPWPDLGENEREFLAAHKDAIGLARSRRAGCPSAQLIIAARGESLPDEVRARLAEHLKACQDCRVLAEDVEAGEESGPTNEEKARMRARLAPIFGPKPKLRSRASFWNWALPVTAVAVVAVLAVVFTGIWRARQNREQTTTVAVQKPAPSSLLIATLPLDKPAPRQYGGGSIIWRGSQTKGAGYQEQLQSAMVSYGKDDYAGASRKFSELERKFPEKFEPRFYRGICLLFLNDAEGARHELEASKTMAKPPETNQVSWYLAVAEQRAGENEQALAELQQLCRAGGDYTAQACQAVKASPAH